MWAWSALVLGVFGVFGQVVHLVGYYAHQLLFATDVEPAVGVRVGEALESQTVLESTQISSAAWAVGLAVGLAPAAFHMVRQPAVALRPAI